MTIDGDKIKKLISDYGKDKGYLEKSYVVRFCEDFKLNYRQWNAYCSGSQNLGIKIIEILMDIFPNLDLNWLLKENHSVDKSLKNENNNLINTESIPENILKDDIIKIYKEKVAFLENNLLQMVKEIHHVTISSAINEVIKENEMDEENIKQKTKNETLIK